jgi:hypothetical protein
LSAERTRMMGVIRELYSPWTLRPGPRGRLGSEPLEEEDGAESHHRLGETLGEPYVSFARRLCEPAESFEERQIPTFVQQYIDVG